MLQSDCHILNVIITMHQIYSSKTIRLHAEDPIVYNINVSDERTDRLNRN